MYTRNLEEIDTLANEIKYLIDLHDCSDVEFALYIRIYFARLRSLFRKMSFFFEEEEVQFITQKIEDIRKYTDNLTGSQIKSIGVLATIEDDLEKIHNKLNEKRFKRGLILPMGIPQDETFIAGWESPGG